jgi:hypothetical protein
LQGEGLTAAGQGRWRVVRHSLVAAGEGGLQGEGLTAAGQGRWRVVRPQPGGSRRRWCVG